MHPPLRQWILFCLSSFCQGLLPIHCAAMQGRVDVMQLLLRFDTEDKMTKTLNMEEERHPPSLLHLALANDFVNCAHW